VDNGQGAKFNICRKFDRFKSLLKALAKQLTQAVYRSLLHLSWIDKFVDNIKTIFVDLYSDQLRKPHTSVVECHFDEYFDQQIRELENTGSVRDAHNGDPYVSLKEERPELLADEEPPPIPGLLPGGRDNRIGFIILYLLTWFRTSKEC
jgi:Signal recognition particle, alpha subunit, N-terminal